MHVPVVNQKFTDWEFNQNPYPHFEQWRAMGPVIFNEAHQAYMTTSYRNCAKVLGNFKQFDSQAPQRQAELKGMFGGNTMQSVDDHARHHSLRSILSKEFERSRLEERREELSTVIHAPVDEFVERVRAGETPDAIATMTRRVPTAIIAHLLGVSSDMVADFNTWSDILADYIGEGRIDTSERGEKLRAEAAVATKAMNDYMANLVAERRKSAPSGDLISLLVNSDYAKEQMSEEDVVATCTIMIFAGNETTAKLLATSLVTLAQHEEQRWLVNNDRSLVPQTFEEVHRWQTLTQSTQRHASSDTSEIEGVPIPKGAVLQQLQGAANRDPSRWENPDKFDLTRESVQHLGFGFGMHTCLGQNLARMEAGIWLNHLLDALPDFHLAEAVDYGRGFLLRGPLEIRLTV